MNRKETIIALRPDIPSIQNSDTTSDIERFQNEVIRPILKYQNDIIIAYVTAKAIDRNGKYEELIAIEKERYLDRVILKDKIVKDQLIGMTIGLLTNVELAIYLQNESEYRRRTNTMIRQRVFSQL